MRRASGVVLLVVALLAAAITALWAYMKAFGTEADICPGATCVSGWFGVAAFAALAVGAGWGGLRLVRRRDAGRAG